jgi:methylglyoxal synthase
MHYQPVSEQKGIALVAHDSKKRALAEWAHFNKELLRSHRLYATGTTGAILEQTLGIDIMKLNSGPLGGDQQLGAKIVEGEIDLVIFFWDPLQAQPHDPDVKALLRVAVVWNIPIACNRSSADMMISSPLMQEAYQREVPDYTNYQQRPIAEEPDLDLATILSN